MVFLAWLVVVPRNAASPALLSRLDDMTALMWFALGLFLGIPVGILIAALCCASEMIER